MLRRWVLPIVAILLVGAGGLFLLGRLRGDAPPIVGPGSTGARDPDRAPAPTPPTPEPPATVLFGGEIRGRLWIPPCGQPGRGGLAFARDALLEFAKSGAGAGLLLDTGDLASAPGLAGLAEASAALAILSEVGLGAVAVGEADLHLGLEAWRILKNDRSGRVVTLCANLRDDDGLELAAGTAEFLLGGRRVVVTATLSPSFEADLRAAGVPVRLAPPAESVRAALGRAGKGDLVVLLSHAPAGETRALLKDLAEVDVAATAHGDEGREEPEIVDGRPLFHPGAGWRRFVGARFPAAAAGGPRPRMEGAIRGEVGSKPGGPSFPEVPLDLALMQLRDRDTLALSYRERKQRATAPAGPAHAGPASCLPCHESAHASWGAGVHARSMAKVRRARFEVAPLCLSCHATGLGAPGGYPDGGAAQAAVTCEACHGPGAAHAAEPKAARLADGKSSCVACHTAEISPGFDLQEAWKRAGHAK